MTIEDDINSADKRGQIEIVLCCGVELECRNFHNTCTQCSKEYNLHGHLQTFDVNDLPPPSRPSDDNEGWGPRDDECSVWWADLHYGS